MPENRLALSLFWRTFILLGLLLTVGIVAWVQTFRALEFEPRAVQSAQQIASLVNLSRAGLRYADSINRVTLIKALFEAESITLKPSEPADTYLPFEKDRFTRTIAAELRARLGLAGVVIDGATRDVGDIAALVSVDRFAVGKRDARGCEAHSRRLQITHEECRMRLGRGPEIRIHAEVYRHPAALEPAAASRREVGRLGNFG